MEEETVQKFLEQLLENSGVQWVREGGFTRFRVRRDGCTWEVDCRCGKGGAVVCGRWPFSVPDRAAALGRCGEINLRLDRGAMVLPPDNRPVFRDFVELDDPYGAAERLRRGLEYNLRTVVRFWNGFDALRRGGAD